MKSDLRTVNDHGIVYEALAFVCPGCVEAIGGSGSHMLPVNTGGRKTPSWEFDGNLEAPTLSPSILSRVAPYDNDGRPIGVCHSFIRGGVIEFLSDCTHSLAGQFVPLPDLPDWFTEEASDA